MVTAWDYPIMIVGMVIVAVTITVWLMRSAATKPEPDFFCSVCGRSVRLRSSREWRYCPYCGVPRDSKRLSDLPGKKPSILDV